MQPFIRGEIVVMCNGEIYNHNKLKQKYNIQTVSNSDCECILDLYILLNSSVFLALSLLGFYFFQDLSWFHFIANCTFLVLAIFIFFIAANYKKILSLNLWFLLGVAVFFTIGPLLEFSKDFDKSLTAIALSKVNLLNASTAFAVALLSYFISRKFSVCIII